MLHDLRDNTNKCRIKKTAVSFIPLFVSIINQDVSEFRADLHRLCKYVHDNVMKPLMSGNEEVVRRIAGKTVPIDVPGPDMTSRIMSAFPPNVVDAEMSKHLS